MIRDLLQSIRYDRVLELQGLAKVTRSDDEAWRQIATTPCRFAELEPHLTRWCSQPNFALLHRMGGMHMATSGRDGVVFPGLRLWVLKIYLF